MTQALDRCINCRTDLYHASGTIETDMGHLCRTCLTMLPPSAVTSPFNKWGCGPTMGSVKTVSAPGPKHEWHIEPFGPMWKEMPKHVE